MSNRYFKNQFVQSMEKDVKQIFVRFTVGASGAPTLDATRMKGVQSIVRNSAGNYTITFGTPASSQAATTDKYLKLLSLGAGFTNATAPAAPSMYVQSDTISTNGQITVQFNAAGTATDPASGEAIRLHFIFGDSNTI